MKIKRKYQKHAITIITLFGKHFCSTKGNLFEVIKTMGDAYIVDNNVCSWEKLSALPENANTAFILGTTIDKERPSSLSLFEGPHGLKVRQNVFHFGMKSPTPDDVALVGKAPLLCIQRLDEHCFDFLDREGIAEWKRSGKNWNDSEDIKQDKEKVLQLLGVRTVQELGEFTFVTREAKTLSFKAKLKPNCRNASKTS